MVSKPGILFAKTTGNPVEIMKSPTKIPGKEVIFETLEACLE